MSTIRVVNLQHTDATEPNIVLESDGTAVFASGITISGGTNLTISGIAEFASGTVSAPTITFIDDNNTGIYEPAVDTVAITTSGTERLRVDSSGNVGIGTTSPSSFANFTNLTLQGGTSGSNLDFFNSSGTRKQAIVANASNGLSIECIDAGAINFNTNNTERMRIDSSGKLVVGATSFLSAANSYAQVMTSDSQGGLIINSTDTSSSSYGRLLFTPNGNLTGNEGLIRYNNNDYHMAFYTQGGERMRIDSAGNVGIGASVPQSILHIGATSSTAFPSSFGGNTAYTPYAHELSLHNGAEGVTNSFTGIYFDAGANSSGAAASTARISAVRTGDYKADLVFGTRSTSFAERMRILSGGGLTFNGDTATANALDDYEEGSWTPTISAGGSSITVDTANTIYVKVGSMVVCQFEIYGLTSPTGGTLIFEGFPFTPANEGTFPVMSNNVTFPSSRTMLTGYYGPSEWRIYASGSGVGWDALIGTEMGTTGSFIGTISYRAS